MPASYVPVLGGLQAATHAVARHLRARGHDVRVVTARYPRSLPAAESIDGVPVERRLFLTPRRADLRRGRPDLFVASLYHQPATRARLARLVRSFRPDVVNVHFPDAQVPAVLWLRERFRFRLVVSLHGHDVERFTGEGTNPPPGGYDDRGLRTILRAADAVTACSGHLLAQACRLEPAVAGKGVAIENGIDPVRFEDRTPYPHPRPYILGLGRLTRKKGFDLLIEALARVGPAAAGFDLLIAGDGEEAGRLAAQVRQLGLAERVRFLGRVGADEVVRLLNGCAFLAVPSRSEPFGIVALEGLAAGKPVLATRVGGMGEFLGRLSDRGRMITLVEPATERLAAGLRAQLTRPLGTEALRGRELAAEFAWDQVAGRYELSMRGIPQSLSESVPALAHRTGT
jgi:glycogen(starch) synthase